MDVPTGARRLIIRRYGYWESVVSVTVTTSPQPLTLALMPDPALHEELSVLAERIVDSRPRFAATAMSHSPCLAEAVS